MVIYLSTKYTPPFLEAQRLRQMGHVPVVSFKARPVDHPYNVHEDELLSRCDALLDFGDNGCHDHDIAVRLGMPIFHGIDEVPDHSSANDAV